MILEEVVAYWLLKTEPDDYNWATLNKEGSTVWDGIGNNTALKHLRTARPGDQAFIYHTGDERAIIGVAKITSAAYPDPNEVDSKFVVVDLKAGHALARPVTLAEIKTDPIFACWDLIRLGRLSVVPVTSEIWKHVGAISKRPQTKKAK